MHENFNSSIDDDNKDLPSVNREFFFKVACDVRQFSKISMAGKCWKVPELLAEKLSFEVFEERVYNALYAGLCKTDRPYMNDKPIRLLRNIIDTRFFVNIFEQEKGWFVTIQDPNARFLRN